MRNKILSLLVLLLTAATGAWAQDPVAKDIVVSPESGTNISDAIKDALGTNGDWVLNITINLAKGGTYTVTESIVPSASITINGNGATIDASGLTTHFIKMRKTPSYDKVESGQYVVRTPSKIENVTITGLTRALFYDNGAPYLFKDFTFNNCLINYSEQGSLIISLAASMVINFTITNSTFYCKDKAKCTANCIAMSGKRPWQVTGFEDSEGKLLVDHNTFYNVAYKKKLFETNTLKGQNKYKYEFNSNIFVNVSNQKIYGNLTNNKNQLTTDGLNTYIWDDTFFSETNYNGDEGLQADPLFKDVENGDFTLDRRSLQYKNSTGDPRFSGTRINFNEEKTEASFNMLAYDVDADYELVRDMTVDVDAAIADRIRIKKENNVYVVVTDGQLTPAVSDKISGTAVAMTVTTDYTAQLQKKTEGDTPTWADATTLSVGTFRYVITGTGLYDGEITTNEFQLFEGYEVTVPAGEYITYYKDEALYVENENAKLYTIASITESEAVLSSEISVAPANTPLLVFNSSDEAKTFLLIPTTDKTPDEVTAATQFVGTLVATTIPASATGADNYALNGYAFVWVKTAIEVGANKCWLHIVSQPASARGNTRSITGGNGTTGIDAIGQFDDLQSDNWYDLNGRKLQSAPNRKGIYIHNGKKVVMK